MFSDAATHDEEMNFYLCEFTVPIDPASQTHSIGDSELKINVDQISINEDCTSAWTINTPIFSVSPSTAFITADLTADPVVVTIA